MFLWSARAGAWNTKGKSYCSEADVGPRWSLINLWSTKLSVMYIRLMPELEKWIIPGGWGFNFFFFLRGKMERWNRNGSGLKDYHKAGNLDFCWAERTGGICGKKLDDQKAARLEVKTIPRSVMGVCQLANRQHTPFDHPFQSIPSSKMGSG